MAGETASYLITVVNSTATPIAAVEVRDHLSSGFTYRANSTLIDAAASPEPALDNGDPGHPIWTVDVPANGSTTIAFDADLAANLGSATYQNEVELVKAGVGIQPFDALATTREDVTVLGAGLGVLEGYVFFDDGLSSGALDSADTRYANVPVVASRNGANCWPQTGLNAYSTDCRTAFTDGNGFFRLLTPSGDWTIDIIDGQGQLPSGLALVVGTDSTDVTVPSQGSVLDLNGFATAADTNTVSAQVFLDADDSGLPSGAESGTNAGGLLALLVDSGGNLLAQTSVAADGLFSFSGVSAGDYEIRLSTVAGTIGLSAPPSSLPLNWLSTGESLDGLSTDGSNDATLEVTVATSAVSGLKFGMNPAVVATPPTRIPTLSPWGFAVLIVLFATLGGGHVRQRRFATWSRMFEAAGKERSAK